MLLRTHESAHAISLESPLFRTVKILMTNSKEQRIPVRLSQSLPWIPSSNEEPSPDLVRKMYLVKY